MSDGASYRRYSSARHLGLGDGRMVFRYSSEYLLQHIPSLHVALSALSASHTLSGELFDILLILNGAWNVEIVLFGWSTWLDLRLRRSSQVEEIRFTIAFPTYADLTTLGKVPLVQQNFKTTKIFSFQFQLSRLSNHIQYLDSTKNYRVYFKNTFKRAFMT